MEAELSVKIVTIILILIATVQQMHTKNVEKIVNTYLSGFSILQPTEFLESFQGKEHVCL